MKCRGCISRQVSVSRARDDVHTIARRLTRRPTDKLLRLLSEAKEKLAAEIEAEEAHAAEPHDSAEFCGRGHELTPENTYKSPTSGATGQKWCRECRKLNKSARS